MPRWISRWAPMALAFATLGCASSGAADRDDPPPAVTSIAPITWSDLDPDTLARARRENRLVLINVVATWCHWCHVMEEETYADLEVTRLLAEHFVTIRVDSDARPDVAERYRAWGWPATAILSPQAQPVVELRGYRSPETFASLLRELVAERDAGTLQHRDPERPSPPADTDLDALRRRVTAQLDDYYDQSTGGWGSVQKYPFAAPVEHALLRARLRDEPTWLERALTTLRGEMHLIDPVWGGMYQYSLRGDWQHPHYEKITAIQAGAIANFAQAARSSGDASWLVPARQIADYMTSMMSAADGGFFTSQDADLRRAERPTVVGQAYYAKDDAGRRALGIPRIDRNVYADLNGAMIHAFVELHAAGGSAADLAVAEAAAERILRTHAGQDGGLRHAETDEVLLHLRDQVWMGRATLALYAATGERRWLDEAIQIATFMRNELEDREGGGFYAHTEDQSAVGVFAQRRKPLEENGLAALFLQTLHHYIPDDDGDGDATPWLRSARRAVLSVGAPERIKAEGRIVGTYLLAIETLMMPRVDVTVVGPKQSAQTTALHRAALAHPEPRAVIEWSRPGTRYPDIGKPAVYLCTATACSSPITDPADLSARLDAFVADQLG